MNTSDNTSSPSPHFVPKGKRPPEGKFAAAFRLVNKQVAREQALRAQALLLAGPDAAGQDPEAEWPPAMENTTGHVLNRAERRDAARSYRLTQDRKVRGQK